MKKKYIAVIWGPDGKPLKFTAIVHRNAQPPIYENDAGTTVTVNLKNKTKTYGNMPYVLTVENVK